VVKQVGSKLALAAIGALTISWAAQPGHAGFELTGDGSQAGADQASGAQGSGAQGSAPQGSAPQGSPDGASFVAGFGRDWPVGLVAQEVVPERYEILFDSTVDRQQTTDWQGGRGWRTVFGEALAPLGLTFILEGDQVKVLDQDKAGVEGWQGGSEMTAARDSDKPGPAAAPGGSDAAKVAAATPREWNARAGNTLHEVLKEWGGEAGWAVAWQTERDYRLEASATFFGDFETAASNLLRAFSIADPPVRATIYRGNRVVVVSAGVDRD